MKAPSLAPAGPKGPAIPKTPAMMVPHAKSPRMRTIKRLMMQGKGGGKMAPFGMGG